jgi:hypothetical protein
MKGTLFGLILAGVLGFLVADWMDAVPWAEGETLSFATLGPGETIAIRYRSVGCFHRLERLYQVEGGPARFATAAVNEDLSIAGSRATPEVIGALRASEAEGLDAWLEFLRRRFPGGCTTTTDVVVGYYRHGQRIGGEHFSDASCILESASWENGQIVGPGAVRLGDFPPEIFRRIVPPEEIEHRLRGAVRD